MSYEVVVPDPSGTIASLSALGYSLEAAVADIVDNSIDAGATEVDVHFHWDGDASAVVIADDGTGMTEEALVSAMRLGERGAHVDRGDDELGRFGMGLKTASFSQARSVCVWSKSDGQPAATRSWNLNEVLVSREWRLMKECSASAAPHIANNKRPRGTVVVWTDLHSLIIEGAGKDDAEAHQHFFQEIARVEKHLAMVFCRFLPGAKGRIGRNNLTIRVNGQDVMAWDPFMQDHPATLPQPVQHLSVDGIQVEVRPYILPPKRRLSDEQFIQGAGPNGWLDQQGFYLFRNDRLIVAGDWLGIPGFRKDEKHVLARIAVEIPAKLDQRWAVDIKKASAIPPMSLRKHLTRIGKDVRTKALSVLTQVSRTATVVEADELTFVWRPDKSGGELRLRLNWSHPLIRDALNAAGDGRSTTKSLLRFLEETVPLSALRVMHDGELGRDYEPFSATPPGEVLTLAETIYESFIHAGMSPQAAKQRLLKTPPFNEFTELAAQLGL